MIVWLYKLFCNIREFVLFVKKDYLNFKLFNIWLLFNFKIFYNLLLYYIDYCNFNKYYKFIFYILYVIFIIISVLFLIFFVFWVLFYFIDFKYLSTSLDCFVACKCHTIRLYNHINKLYIPEYFKYFIFFICCLISTFLLNPIIIVSHFLDLDALMYFIYFLSTIYFFVYKKLCFILTYYLIGCLLFNAHTKHDIGKYGLYIYFFFVLFSVYWLLDVVDFIIWIISWFYCK